MPARTQMLSALSACGDSSPVSQNRNLCRSARSPRAPSAQPPQPCCPCRRLEAVSENCGSAGDGGPAADGPLKGREAPVALCCERRSSLLGPPPRVLQPPRPRRARQASGDAGKRAGELCAALLLLGRVARPGEEELVLGHAGEGGPGLQGRRIRANIHSARGSSGARDSKADQPSPF